MTKPELNDGNKEEPETKLLLSAQLGSREDFSRLYEMHAAAVHVWASVRLRSKSGHPFDPMDVVQEVWWRAWRLLPKLAKDTPFRAWLLRIANLVLLEHWKEWKRHQTTTLGGERESVSGIADDATTISQRMARDESLRLLVQRIGTLDPEDQELILLRGLEERSFEEIARRMDLDAATLRKRWQRIRDRLDSEDVPRLLGAG